MEILPNKLIQERYSEYEILARSTRYGINLHPFWFASYIEAYELSNRELILEVRNEQSGELYGLLPLVRKDDHISRFIKQRRLVPLGYYPTDFFDILSVEGAENKVTKAIVNWLISNKKSWDQILINLIPTESKSWQPFVKYLENAGIKPEVKTDQFFLRIDVTKPYRDYLNNLGTKKQKEIRYYKNKIIKLGARFEFEIISQGLIQYFDDFLANYIERRSVARQIDPFVRTPFLYNFTKAIIHKYEERGWIRLSILKMDNKIIAYAYLFIQNHIVYYHMPAFLQNYKEYAPGKLLLFEIIRNAFEDTHIHEVNLMRSKEDSYKDWFQPDRHSYTSITVNNPWSNINKAMPILSMLSKLRKHFVTT